jgi:hypothetical protein
MNKNMRVTLCELNRKGIIDKDDLLKFLSIKVPKEKDVKDLIMKSIDYSYEEKKVFIVNVFERWKDVDKVWHSEEILVLNRILNNFGVMTRQEIIDQTELKPKKASESIDGLVEEGIVRCIPIFNNEKLVFLNKKAFSKVVMKSEN